MTMTPDPHGYARLKRGMDFLTVEAREVGIPGANALEEAVGHYGYGSPTEFMGESLMALDATLVDADHLSPSVRQFAGALAAEIRRGFDQVGGG